jgi:hypothetical protein
MSARKAPDFEKAALRLARLIGAEDCRLTGALAVGAHGFVRATSDVDLVARPPLREVSRRLGQGGVQARLHRGDTLERDFPCLRGSLDGVPFDVIPPLVAVDWERGPVALAGRGASLRVVPLDAILAFKMRAQGPKDLMDAAMLVLLHPEARATALELAQAYRALELFRVWLEDPRMARDAQAIRSAEARQPRATATSRRRRGGKS